MTRAFQRWISRSLLSSSASTSSRVAQNSSPGMLCFSAAIAMPSLGSREEVMHLVELQADARYSRRNVQLPLSAMNVILSLLLFAGCIHLHDDKKSECPDNASSSEWFQTPNCYCPKVSELGPALEGKECNMPITKQNIKTPLALVVMPPRA